MSSVSWHAPELQPFADVIAADDAMPSPFDEEPSALARRAAEPLQRRLAAGCIAPGISTDVLFTPGGGKMFGALVVATPGGEVGALYAFSGTLEGRWHVAGFAPPLFDHEARAAFEPDGTRVVAELLERGQRYADSEELSRARRDWLELTIRQERERAELRARHRTQRERRHRERFRLRDDDSSLATDALHDLDQASRADKAERRHLDARHAEERRGHALHRRRCERRLLAHQRLRRMVSRHLMRRIHDCYAIRNGLSETARLRDLYLPAEPPAGAADCAAPKLIGHAIARGLRPLALAEFWWGVPPPTGGRVSGVFYPACREKCAPLLPFLLRGVEVRPTRSFVPTTPANAVLSVVYEDDWIIVVDKPAGLLSVPGHGIDAADSVATRLQLRNAAANPAHRLDLDTSGLLVVARDPATLRALQRQFAREEVRKRYVAVVDGDVAGDRGCIELALRPDRHERPRQVHDPVHGKPARTTWEVIERAADRTRVALYPHTGRTHQLRVHAAHPAGLGAPIRGDRLYGTGGERLLLHAQRISFRHPASGRLIELTSSPPF